jgi:hypothetical protein
MNSKIFLLISYGVTFLFGLILYVFFIFVLIFDPCIFMLILAMMYSIFLGIAWGLSIKRLKGIFKRKGE